MTCLARKNYVHLVDIIIEIVMGGINRVIVWVDYTDEKLMPLVLLFDQT
jgi:hypothetical protein